MDRRGNNGTPGGMIYRGRDLIPHVTRGGYFRVGLWLNNKFQRGVIHRLVAEAFLPRVVGKNEVNHKNGIKTDNRVENLEWVDRTENHRHAVAMGLWKAPKGDNHFFSKLKEDEVLEIFRLLEIGELYQREIAKRFGISEAVVGQIKLGKAWKHLCP